MCKSGVQKKGLESGLGIQTWESAGIQCHKMGWDPQGETVARKG
jgi:hypothetical protein